MPSALLHRPSPALKDCQLTFIERQPIDYPRALAQHAAYAAALRDFGLQVRMLDVNPNCADSVFVEDVAVVLDELAILTSMGNPARRGELPAMASAIADLREIVSIALPAALEGGDVLRVGKRLYVGEGARTNRAGISELRRIVSPLGYEIVPVKVPGCLHLKTCITALDPETFLYNSAWLDAAPFDGSRLVPVHPEEPWAANTLSVNGSVLVNGFYPGTADRLEALGYDVVRLNISEFSKAEAGLTCMSLIFP